MRKQNAPGNSGKAALPKYKKIKSYILEGIASRGFTDALPSENKLAEFFSVSRMTARKAMDELEKEGHISRVNGKGSFVKKQKHYSGFFRVRPFKEWAKDLEAETSTEVLATAVIETPPEIASLLDYPEQVVHVRRVNYLNELPVRYAVHYLRPDRVAGILMDDLENESVYDLLASKYHIDITKISQDLLAIGLPKKIASIFKVPPGYPAFHFKRVEFSNEQPLCYVEYYMRGEMPFRDVFSPKLERSLPHQ